MKFCLFEIINLQPVAPGKFAILPPIKDVPVNPSHVLFVMPAQIPTDVAGPNGEAMSKEGTKIQLAGAALLVDQRRDLVLWRLVNDLVDLTGMEAPVVKAEPEPELPTEGPRRLRLPFGGK